MKLHLYIRFVFLFFLFSRMSCEENIQEPTFTPGIPSEFRINQLYTSSDGQYTLTIQEIGDSRCPEGVVCVWEGEVSIKGEWTWDTQKSAIELHSVLTDQQKIPEGFAIQLLDAKPYPKSGTDSNPNNLVLTLLIQKK